MSLASWLACVRSCDHDIHDKSHAMHARVMLDVPAVFQQSGYADGTTPAKTFGATRDSLIQVREMARSTSRSL